MRALLPSDAQALAELWTDPEVTRFMGGPRDFDELRATFLEEAQADEKRSIHGVCEHFEEVCNAAIGP